MTNITTRDYETGYKDGLRSAEASITSLRAEVERLKAVENDYDDHEREMIDLEEDNARLCAENERLRAALKTARPFIGWAVYYPTLLDEIDAALEGK